MFAIKAHTFKKGSPNPKKKTVFPPTIQILSNRLNKSTKRLKNEVIKGNKASEQLVNRLMNETLRVAGAYIKRLEIESNRLKSELKSEKTPNTPNLSPTTLAKINRELQNLHNEVNLEELEIMIELQNLQNEVNLEELERMI